MNIKITSKDGITLKTKDTYIREDISVAVDESILGGDGAVVKTTGDWQGTPVPNTGMVEKIYFNAEMSLGNITTLLSKLQYIQTPFIDVPIYPVLFTTNGVCGFITDDGNNKHRIYVAPDITDPSSSILIFSNLEGYGDKIGWQGLINPSWNNLDVNQNVISEYSGLPIGFENDKISSVLSVTQFVETGESQEVLLEGEYDGSSVEITENTTLDIKSLIENDKRIPLSVNVNVPTGGGGATGFVDGTITEYSGQDTSVRERAFYLCQVITSIDLPNATSVGLYSFGNCINLTSINLPNATSIGESAFFKCQELTSIKLPKATTIGRQSFYYCYKLESVNLPSVTYLDRYAFGYCHSLKAVIIGQETKVCTLYDTNVFNNCYHINGTVNATYNPNGLKDGYIYVPDSLVDSYKSATNWSTYADQIKPLSEYVEA